MIIINHAQQRMTERDISLAEVSRCISFGRRMKGGWRHQRLGPGEVLRVCCSGSGKKLTIITAVRKVYEPDFK